MIILEFVSSRSMDRRMTVAAAVAVVLGWHCLQCLNVRAEEAQTREEPSFPGRTQYTPSGSICDIFVRPQRYACDELQVQTDDGFVLGVQRLSTGAGTGITGRKPVFLYHGMLSGGESWLLNERDRSLPLLLADAGYDVWIGNTRTTDFSYGHVSASRDDEKFWDWSTDDLVAHDLPSMVGLVYASTNQTVHYIGFSQGTQVAVAAFAEGQVIPLVDKVVLLAPVVRLDSVNSALAIAGSLFLVDQMMLIARVWEFSADLTSGEKLLDTICQNPEARCDNDLLTAFTGPNCCINESKKSYYEQYETQSTATKNLAHFAQQYRTNTFGKYDYGLFGNLGRYHSIFPPVYDLSKIPEMPLLVVHGGTDGLADTDDVHLFINSLSFSPQVIFIPDYGHVDFLLSQRVNVDVYSKVVDFLAPSTP